MNGSARLDHMAKIADAKSRLKIAGPIHRRDLLKHIRRMERELRDYDRFHREAEMRGINAKR